VRVCRRDAIAQTRICARLSVNGNELGRTAYHRIEYPRFATRIDFTFHLRLLRPPDELKIEVLTVLSHTIIFAESFIVMFFFS
jgi:hypothetical protein